jgi:hypothetical protein
VQFGVFSPILRLHSTKNPYHERRPWAYDAETFRITRAAMQLRHALLPYSYSAAWRSFVEGKTLILPMYFQHAGEEAAYHCPNQYYFGSELIVAPYVTPLHPDTRLSRQAVWLPEGDWFDFSTGERYAGGRWQVLYGALEEIPVLARAGGIVPMGPPMGAPIGPQDGRGGIANPEELIVHVFAGADNAFTLYEDDGVTQAYLKGKHCITPLFLAWYGDRLEFTIAPVKGDPTLVPAWRTVHLVVHGIRSPEVLRLTVNGIDAGPGLAGGDGVIYDAAGEALTVRGIRLTPTDEVRLSLGMYAGALLSGRDRRPETCRKLLRSFRLDTNVKQRLDLELDNIMEGRASLMSCSTDLTDAQLSALEHTVQR